MRSTCWSDWSTGRWSWSKNATAKRVTPAWETIRQYGCEKLEESGELDLMRRRHLDYFLDSAERGDRWSRGPQSLEWKRRLDSEHNNLRAALEFAFSEEGG